MKLKKGFYILIILSGLLGFFSEIHAQAPFISELKGNHPDSRYTSIFPLDKGGFLTLETSGNLQSPIITKFNKCERLKWSKKSISPNSTNNSIKNVHLTTNDNAIYLLEVYTYKEPFLKEDRLKVLKLNEKGQKLWSKELQIDSVTGMDLKGVVETSNGGIMAFLSAGYFQNAFFAYFKINPNGQMAWIKTLTFINNRIFIQAKTQKNRVLLSFGRRNSSQNFFIALNSKGVIEKKAYFKKSGSTLNFGDLTLSSKDNYYFLIQEISNSSETSVLKTDTNFKPVWFKTFKSNITIRFDLIQWRAGNGPTLIGPGKDSTLHLLQLSQKGSVKRSNSINAGNKYFETDAYVNENFFSSGLKRTRDSSLLIMGFNSVLIGGYYGNPIIIKTNKQNRTSCRTRPLNRYQLKDSAKVSRISRYNPTIDTPEATFTDKSFTLRPVSKREKIICSEKLYPQAHLGADTLLCAADSLTLKPRTDTSLFRYQWNTGNKTPHITVDTSGKYSLAITHKGCTSKDSINVAFRKDSREPFQKDTFTICPYDSIKLQAKNPAGFEYRWLTPATKLEGDSIWANMEGKYQIWLKNNPRCRFLDSFYLNHYTLSQNIRIPNDTTICPYDTFQLQVPDSIDQAFNWEIPKDSGKSVIVTDTNKIKAHVKGQYKLIDPAQKCVLDTFKLNHYRLPSANAGPDTLLCHNQTYTMQGKGGIFYRWIPAKYLSSDTIPDPKAQLPHKQEYALIVKNQAGCADTSSVLLDVRPPLEVGVSQKDSLICQDEIVHLTAKGKGGKPGNHTYRWLKSNTKGKKLTFEAFKDRQTIVKLSDQCSKPAYDTTFINVNPKPVVDFTTQPADSAMVNQAVQFQNRSEKAQYFKWKFANEKISHQKNPLVNFPDSGTKQIRLTARTQMGCVDTASQKLYIDGRYKVFIPNAFSPNNDGLNDAWQIKGQGIKNVRFTIYNRWGEKIHSSELSESWDGTIRDTQQKAPVGTYLFKVGVKDLFNRNHFYSGELHLIR